MLNYELKNEIAFIELADGKANVFSPAMLQAVNEALDKAENESKAVVISGAGDKFSAGFDLQIVQQGGNQHWEMVLAGFELLHRLYQFPLPVIAAVGGHALGMGAFVLLVSDTRVGIEGDYKIGLPETAGNMPFTNYLVAILQAELHPRYMKRGALQSQFCNPVTAVEADFLDMVVPEDHLQPTINKIAEGLMQLPSKQYAHNKKELRADNLALMRSRLDALKQQLL